MKFANQQEFLNALESMSDEEKQKIKQWSVGDSLDLSGTRITSLPEGLSVGGSLYLLGTQITSVPEKFKKKVSR